MVLQFRQMSHIDFLRTPSMFSEVTASFVDNKYFDFKSQNMKGNLRSIHIKNS